MQEELKIMEEQEVWTVVPIPNRNIVGSKWVFRIKKDENRKVTRFKARLVAKGFTQQPGVDFDEVFSPVVRFDTLRVLIAKTVQQQGWSAIQLDIKAAFLYGTLHEEIYMVLPEGQQEEGMCAKLNKSIYGLKQSPREWYARLTTYLLQLGFNTCTFDPCVFTNGTSIIAVYVDDISIFGPLDEIGQIKELLRTPYMYVS